MERNGSSSGWWCGELAELFSVSYDAFGEGFDGGAQVSDFGGEAGQASGVGLSGLVFVDDGAQLLVAGAPVSKNYKPPFAYEGRIDSIEIEIGDPGLDPDEEAKLHARFRAGKEC